jgi:glycosyltransferase involved in cell wall biosynthesis
MKLGHLFPNSVIEHVSCRLSVIVCTRNRAQAIVECLNSIAAALANAASLSKEIVVVDNGSTDDTRAAIIAWASTSAVTVQLLTEPRPGLSRARNRALSTARGDLLVFTDDDCRLGKDYVSQLLRHDAADTDLVIRGGRIELGDTTDLPITINNDPNLIRSSRKKNSAARESLIGRISGCNMTMRRALVERVGPFDEDFGAGARFMSADDTDYI